jgi:Glycerophosphoryl diester phosphodiesterase
MRFKSFFDPMPRVVAHRGDSAHFPENTLPAFMSAVKMKIDVIETDVHLTKDNVVVIWHDPTLERNTDGCGIIEEKTLSELKALDAGYTFTRDGGKTYPFRGAGVRLTTLEEALTACPEERFNIDLKTKSPEMVKAFLSVIRRTKAENRIVCASFHLSNLKMVRKIAPDITTSITTLEVVPLLAAQKLRLLSNRPFKRKIVFQIPKRQWGINVVTPAFVKKMHKKGAIVMVWTINDEETMRELFNMGVDAVMTDHPALVIKVAENLGIREV